MRNMAEVMHTNFSAVSPGDTILRAIFFFRTTKSEALPVVDKDELVGVVTRANVFDALLSGHTLSDSIQNIYRRSILKVKADWSYDQVKVIAENSSIGGAVVVDNDDHIIGLFGKAEMISASLKHQLFLNAQLRAIYDSIGNGLILTDENGQVVLINTTIEEVFDLKPGKVLGLQISEIIPGLDILKSQPDLIGIKKTHSINGKQAIVSVRTIFTKKVMGFIVILQEIIELEKIATELESVKRLNKVLETVLEIGYDGIGVIDEQGLITLANQSFVDFYQLDKEKIVGVSITQVIENSRLFIVAKTGIAEINQVDFVGDTPCIVSRMPIVQSGKVIGAIEKIVYSQVEQLKEIAQRLDVLDNTLSYYKNRLRKDKSYKSFFSFEDIVTINPLMEKLKQEAQQASRGKSTVLIIGESGTGKELFAQSIHLASPRSKGPFISVNCAAIPENLLESEFFGYAPGAFTGANKSGKRGYFEQANVGTLFLDEIGDMPLSLQAKLLRVLQDSKFQRVGGTETIAVDVRVVAATNQNLMENVKNGSFRQDLYYRINVIPLHLVPLRDRKEDIMPLTFNFIREHSDNENLDISAEVIACLESYGWPGNVRELENVIERAINFTVNNQIEIWHLPQYLLESFPFNASIQKAGTENNDLNPKLNRTEKELIIDALKQAKGNKSKAAKSLGISRAWIYVQMRKLNIEDV